MSVIPSGISIQEIYRRYRENPIVVNRKYQWKLVWTEDEKESLIDSIIKGYPIPLILFAESTDADGKVFYEMCYNLTNLQIYLEH